MKKMDSNFFEMIEKYAGELAAMEGYDRQTWKIMINHGGDCYETAGGSDFAALSQEDIKGVGGEEGGCPIEAQILQGDNEINAVVLSRTPFCLQAAKRPEPLTAALDDMAQIVGYQVRTVSYEKGAIDAALKKATGCFIRAQDRAFTLTTGRNLYEAVVALTVLEKSAEVNLRAEAIGGAKPLPKIEADLMRMIYKKKYSVAEQEVKSKEGDA